MAGHQGIANKEGNIFEHECFIETLFFVYLMKEYHNIGVINQTKAQNRDNIIDDINLRNIQKEMFVCEAKTSFKGKEESIIRKFYLSIRDNKATGCILFTKDRWPALETLLEVAKEYDDSTKFNTYLLSENAKTFQQYDRYLKIQEILKKEEIKNYISSTIVLDTLYISKILEFLKKVQILHKLNKDDLLNRIKDSIPTLSKDKPELNCLYNSISAKSFSDWSKGIPVSKSDIDNYLKENLEREYQIIDVGKIASLGFGESPDIFISQTKQDVL